MDTERNEVEICSIPPLGPQQQAILDNHSVLNVLNVLAGELALLGLALEDNPDAFPCSLRYCHDFSDALRNGVRDIACAESTPTSANSIEAELAAVCGRHPARLVQPAFLESIRNIHGVLGILRLRSLELRARSADPSRWDAYQPGTLRNNFTQVFEAMEGISHGRYRIVNSPFAKGPRDYFIELDFDARPENRLWMPSVFIDVMRDLVSNARKYTPPGGWIVASLHQDARELRFSVQDSGVGIPLIEIPEVVGFGQRGSNVRNVRTIGGGYGLTKAFTVTKRFNGRLWIASEEGQGTRVRITLPRPELARN
jgi:signal transduction histidine kinase